MKELEERILRDGVVINDGLIKIDSFLNHQVDTKLLGDIAKDIREFFKGRHVDKILTIEASGIAIGYACALEFGCQNFVFARKDKRLTMSDTVYSSEAFSFTKKKDTAITVDKRYIERGENILIVDDFLAEGSSGLALVDICKQAGADVVGYAAAVEKTYQGGRERLEKYGFKVYSAAKIKGVEDGKVIF